MAYHNGNARLSPDANRFIHCSQNLRAFTAQMYFEYAAGKSRRARDVNDFFRGCGSLVPVCKPERESERSFAERPAQKYFHALPFFKSKQARLIPHDASPKRTVADQGGKIYSGSHALYGVQKLVHAGPIDVDLAYVNPLADAGDGIRRKKRRQGRAAVASHDRGDTLQEHAFLRRMREKSKMRVRVVGDVNKSGRDVFSGSRNLYLCRPPVKDSDIRDFPVCNSNIQNAHGRAGAVYD